MVLTPVAWDYIEANFGNLLLVVIPAVCEEDGNPFGLPNSVCTEHGLSYASFSMAVTTLSLFIWLKRYDRKYY